MSNHRYTNFPRIFSLSTAGIKYHGYRDYLFHPLRTDFVGESGYGKSMIGDILQLIFVGSGEFRSGTEVDVGKERKPQGMVLEQGDQSSLGYVFLNIEVESEKFIVIGMYIESNVNRTTPFIIQSGHDWSEKAQLVPLSIPLTHRAFVQNESLLPVEMVQERFDELDDEQNIVIEVFWKGSNRYHTILQHNNILPMDFSGDVQKLKDYVRILQSFARGKGFKFDSESIKSFLFGSKESEDIFRGFDAESKILKSSLEQYQNNKLEIANIELIGEKLRTLEAILQKWQHDRHAVLKAEAQVLFLDLETIKSDILGIFVERHEVYYKLLLLDQREKYLLYATCQQDLQSYQEDKQSLDQCIEQQNDLKSRVEALEDKGRILEPEYSAIKKVAEQISNVEDMLNRYGNSEEKLREQFTLQQRLHKEKAHLEEFTSYLQVRNILDRFEQSLWSRDLNAARAASQEHLSHLDNEIQLLESLRLLANVSDPNSLARWALAKAESLSVEQESTLIYLQELPRREAPRSKGQRYLPNPDAVLEQLVIEGQGSDGFWLNLGGVREFIPIHALGLTSGNKVELRKYLEEKQIEFENRYQKLLAEKKDLQEMSKALEEFGYNQSYADIFVNRLHITSFQFDDMISLSPENLDSALLIYRQRIDLLAKYNDAKRQYEANQQEIRYHSGELGRVAEKINNLEKGLEGKDLHRLHHLFTQSETSLNKARESLQKCTRPSSGNLEEFAQMVLNVVPNELGNLRADLSKRDGALEERMNALQRDLPHTESLYLESRGKYETEFGSLPIPTDKLATTDVVEFRDMFESSNKNLNNKINSFIIEHAPQSKHLLENTIDINYIARMVLPRVFTGKEENLSITEQIAKRLDFLNEKNRELDGSSADTILRFFRDVLRSYEKQITVINRLRQFFNSQNAVITGGYRVKLITRESKEYPISWINDLRDGLTLTDMPLFADQVDENTLQDIVIETFKRHTDGTKMPDIRKLLDPKSYFDVSFMLENERGQTYGSEGQAYTAVSLLCIARLSLVEDGRGKLRQGVRFMPIDEAEGIGSNYHTLYSLAVEYGYQVVSMSINSVTGIKAGEQTVYTLIANPDPYAEVNSDPFPMVGYYHDYVPLFFPQDEK